MVTHEVGGPNIRIEFRAKGKKLNELGYPISRNNLIKL